MQFGFEKMNWEEVEIALKELLNNQDNFINQDVYNNALKHIKSMNNFPVPRIWSHGPNSVVFDWGHFLLTINNKNSHGLISESI